MAEMTEQEELQVFQLITAAGSAKSTFMEALYKAKEGKYDEAENLFKEADGYFVEGHHAHAAMIEAEGQGVETTVRLVLAHAEDQLMSAELTKTMVEEMIALYTNNKVATLQAANDFDGIIAMADALLAKNAENALAQKVRLQAYASKKDYNKVIELGEAAAKVQTDPEDVSLMYLTLGAAYNAKEMKPQAIAAFKQVTDGPAAENAKAALAELSK